jgi:ketosteroid isomerase-like protein
MNSEQTLPPVVGRYFEALATGDSAGLKKCFSVKARWIAPGQLPNSGTWEGRDEIVDGFFPIATNRMVPGSFSTRPVSITVGETNTVVEWVASAVTLSGQTYENSYIANLVIEDDQITEVREYCDTQKSEVLFR